MTRICKEVAKMLAAVVLCLVYLWFALSFVWSLDDMSVAEKVVGVAYLFLMVPLYEGAKRLLRIS